MVLLSDGKQSIQLVVARWGRESKELEINVDLAPNLRTSWEQGRWLNRFGSERLRS